MTLEEQMSIIRIDALSEGRNQGIVQAYRELGLTRADAACKLRAKLDISGEEAEEI